MMTLTLYSVPHRKLAIILIYANIKNSSKALVTACYPEKNTMIKCYEINRAKLKVFATTASKKALFEPMRRYFLV